MSPNTVLLLFALLVVAIIAWLVLMCADWRKPRYRILTNGNGKHKVQVSMNLRWRDYGYYGRFWCWNVWTFNEMGAAMNAIEEHKRSMREKQWTTQTTVDQAVATEAVEPNRITQR